MRRDYKVYLEDALIQSKLPALKRQIEDIIEDT
jgi:hypothetical protein